MSEPLYLGVDGGGTKTVAWVATPTDGVVGVGRAGPANHQESDVERAARAVQEAVEQALEDAAAPAASVRRGVLALAGADFPEDVARLEEVLGPLLAPVPCHVVNDAEAALVGGSHRGWGVVVIAGTGTNVLARDERGHTFHLGGLGYEFGDVGGGQDLVRAVLHAVFRSGEGRGPATALHDAVLSVLSVPDLEQLARGMYFGTIDREQFQLLAPLAFQMASRGDRVAQDLLVDMGMRLGESAGAACSRLANPGGVPVEVVLAGSLWHGPHPLLRDGFHVGLHRYTVSAEDHLPALEPVAGAVLMAAEPEEASRGAALRQCLEEVRSAE